MEKEKVESKKITLRKKEREIKSRSIKGSRLHPFGSIVAESIQGELYETFIRKGGKLSKRLM